MKNFKQINAAEMQNVRGGDDTPDKPIEDGMFITPDGMIGND